MGNTMKHFSNWLNNSITYKTKLSQDGAGDIVYGSDQTFSCYIVGGTELVTNDKSEEVVSTEQIYLDGATSGVSGIDFTGLVVINSRERPIKSIGRFYDEDGNLDFIVIYL